MSDPIKTSFADGNRFYILGEFNDELHVNIVWPLTKKIEELSKVKDAEIEFYINSPGGSGYTCMHLVQLFELAKAKGIIVKTIVPQYAFSAGSMLAIAGSPGHRYLGSTAEHLIHYGTQYGDREHTPTQIERNTEHKKRWFKTLLGHYQRYAEVPELAEHIKDDNFFITAKDSIKWKLADKYMAEL